MNVITVALDVMGGDHGPSVVIPAALDSLKRFNDLKLILVGDQNLVRTHLRSLGVTESSRLTIHHATEVVGMDELPSQALRYKKNSSMRVAIDLVKDKVAHACVSAGNTGALMATARFVLKMLPGIDRPAILAQLPNIYGTVRMLDLGANIEATPEQLCQFSIMGSVFVSAIADIPRPRLGLLNIGEEEIKGNEAVKAVAQWLSTNPDIHYIGYVEGDDIFMGEVDVIVCDGFVGNAALKASEGSAKFIKYYLKRVLTENWYGKLCSILLIPLLKKFGKHIDPDQYNGASLLGLKGIVIKSHGGASQVGFSRAIEEALLQARSDVPNRISQQVATLLQRASFAHVEK